MSHRKRKDSQLSTASCSVLALLLSAVFLLGLATEFNLVPRVHAPSLGAHKKNKPDYHFPNFNKIIHHYTVSERELGLDDPDRRVIVIGDVHGMNRSLHNLLAEIPYSPETDTLMFAGDLMAKSTHAGSLAVLDFITRHKCGRDTHGRAYAVRGNHDQMVVQWRAWRDWFEPLVLAPPLAPVLPADARADPPVRTGWEFLALLEAEWEAARRNDPKGSDPDTWADTARKRAVGTWREEWWRRIPRPGKGDAKKDWAIFEDHYWLAKDVTAEQKVCLYSLPLVLHVPSEHFFVVHAGLLPSDPRRPFTDAHQPLAHSPTADLDSYPVAEFADTVDHNDKDNVIIPYSDTQQALGTPPASKAQAPVVLNGTEEQLRMAQERALLTQVPQNRDPWVLLNMRGVRKKGKVTRNNGKGRQWSKIWNEQIDRCAGFDSRLTMLEPTTRSSRIHGTAFTNPASDHILAEREATATYEDDSAHGELTLPCEPMTVVYGHAATRGLDVKRWSLGLDTGCLYGRKLTGLVLQRGNSTGEESDEDDGDDGDEDDSEDGSGDEEEDIDDEQDDEARARSPSRSPESGNVWKPKTWRRPARFGDEGARLGAELVSVRCPKKGDLALHED
ncbi:Metallo-dependent phosphatase [Wolfiporia cocos MD-104 SS10]|uniref:Metallo-dependent phosphatase n=1 Tax=Wolfiporia cocos (strain MD-104) TaxID=742152 RepID=A0A2H3JRK8_WOLCO|nr:Metallo-dependent phosphatase [Wolfiporia cocos MD-104 SS10]